MIGLYGQTREYKFDKYSGNDNDTYESNIKCSKLHMNIFFFINRTILEYNRIMYDYNASNEFEWKDGAYINCTNEKSSQTSEDGDCVYLCYNHNSRWHDQSYYTCETMCKKIWLHKRRNYICNQSIFCNLYFIHV